MADDKAVYAFVPEMIRYYLGEEPILDNVPTYLGVHEDDRGYILDHLDELVVKAVNESGGYGMLIGPARAPRSASASAPDRGRPAQLHRPADDRPEPQPHLPRRAPPRARRPAPVRALRPHHERRARRAHARGAARGILVVNSSQGGGSKDTWVLRS